MVPSIETFWFDSAVAVTVCRAIGVVTPTVAYDFACDVMIEFVPLKVTGLPL